MTVLTLLLAIATMPAASQTPAQKPTFEVASIKQTKAAPGSPSGISSETGRIMARNVTLKRRCLLRST